MLVQARLQRLETGQYTGASGSRSARKTCSLVDESLEPSMYSMSTEGSRVKRSPDRVRHKPPYQPNVLIISRLAPCNLGPMRIMNPGHSGDTHEVAELAKVGPSCASMQLGPQDMHWNGVFASC